MTNNFVYKSPFSSEQDLVDPSDIDINEEGEVPQAVQQQQGANATGQQETEEIAPTQEEPFAYTSPFREPTEEEQLAATQPPDKTVFDEIQEATPSMAGALIGGTIGAPLGPLGILGGAALGGTIGEYAQMGWEWLTGSTDLPDNALDQAKRATTAGLEGAAGEGAGAIISKAAGVGFKVLNNVRSSNLATKALETAKKKVIRSAPPGIRGGLQYGERLNVKQVKQLYKKAATDIAEGAISGLSPVQRGELFLSTLQGGRGVLNAAAKDQFMVMDRSISSATRQGFLSTGQAGGINTNPIKQEITNKIQPFVEGLASPKTKSIVQRVTEYLDTVGPKVNFEQAHTLRTELQIAIDMAEDTGNTRLATALRRSQNKVSEIMGTAAKAAGKETEYKVANNLWVEGSEEVDNTFLRTLMQQDPKAVGSYLISEGTPQQIRKAMNLLQAAGKKGVNTKQLIRDMQEGYFREVFSKTIDPDTGLFRITEFTNILKDPKQAKNLKAALGEDKYEVVQNFVEAVQKQQKNPGDYLVQAGGLIGLITGMIDPTSAAIAVGVPIVRKGVVGAGNISSEVLARLASNPEHIQLLNKTLTTSTSSPQAARLLGQLKTTIAGIVNDLSTEAEGAQATEGAFEYRSPFDRTTRRSNVTEGEVEFEVTSEAEESLQKTRHARTREASEGEGLEEQWIKKYQQINPGVSREEAIKEGKRLKRLPKDYTDPPLGIRNNNPGNIRVSNTNWQGKVEGHKGPFERFETPEHGIRAIATNLKTYQQKYGLNTVSEIISRWAPPNENPTGGYINTVARRTGFKPNEKLNLNDPKVIQKLIDAIIYVENASVPYKAATIQKGIQMAMEKGTTNA